LSGFVYGRAEIDGGAVVLCSEYKFVGHMVLKDDRRKMRGETVRGCYFYFFFDDA
jgi:hypothetical protein